METIHIERMTYGVDALGHLDGKVVFVPYAAPEDTIEIDIRETKADYLRGDLHKVVTPSVKRRESPCPNFPACGGCHWLHLHPEVQRQEKETFLNFVLKPLSPKKVYPLEALPPTGYRNKMDLKLAWDSENRLLLGNYRFHSHDVVSIRGCQVQCSENMITYSSLETFLGASERKALADEIDSIMIRTLGEQKHALLLTKEAPTEPFLHLFRAFFDEHVSLSRLEVVSRMGTHLTLVRERPEFQFMRRSWVVSPRSFFQNNLEGAEAIYYTLLSIYGETAQKGKLIDLYCGVGVQTLLLDHRFEEVVAVESNDSSYQDALKNQKVRSSSRARFWERKVETIFNTPVTKGVIAALHLNPPRTGVSSRTMRGLSGIKPKTITYLSCNPMTFRRDAQAIVNMGYTLERVHAFDLFPGTFHVEVLGVFTR